ncbi:MAG: DNRLRE domain-containing protein [Actinobacteria bacterium]|nr:DNRLRE domain-containing protein [Actinomycetota bacterium]
MRVSLKISVDSSARRPWHRGLVSTLVVLVSLAATSLVAVPLTAEAADRGDAHKQMSPQELPALHSDAPTPRALDIPQGDFSNPPAQHADDVSTDRSGVKAGATLVGRSAGSEIWDNHDGTSTAVVHARPSTWADRDGKHKVMDSRLTRQGARLKNTGGPVGFDLPAATTANEVVVASADGWSLGFAMDGLAAGRNGEVDGASVRYRAVQPGVDLVETIEGDTLKETVVLTELPRPGSTNRFRFPLTMSGLTPKEQADGSIRFYDRAGTEVAAMPVGVAFDGSGDAARGTQAQTPVHLDLIRVAGQWTVELSVDRTWLLDPSRVAPISIDPSATFNAGRDNGSTHSDAFVSQAAPTTNYNTLLDSGSYVDKVGYGSYPTDQFNTFLKYDVSALAGKTVSAATWNGYFLSAAAYPSTYALTQAAASWTDSTLTWNNQPGATGSAATGSVTAANQWATKDITGWVQGWLATPTSNNGIRLDSNGTNAYLRLAAMEQAAQDSYIAVTFANTEPSAPTAVQLTPADQSTVMSLTPTLTSAAMTDAEGDAVQYWFRIATGTDGQTGQLINSGWLTTPSYQVPIGAFQDGMTYHWEVYTRDAWATGPPTTVSPTVSLTVDQGLGRGASDNVGPVSINLTNGNATVSVASPSFQTLGGSIGLSYTYNSQTPVPSGLSGSYYPCTAAAGTGSAGPTFPATGTPPALVRPDTTLNFAWNATSPLPAPGPNADPTNFCVRWSGYVTVPTTSTAWSLSDTHDGGARIYLNNNFTTPYVDAWSNSSGTVTASGAAVALTAGVPTPITIDYYQSDTAANFSLSVAGPITGIVPSSWLTPSSSSVVPSGWSVSTGGSRTLAYTAAKVGNDSFVLTDPAGGAHEYRKVNRAWKPTKTEQAVVTQNSDGTFTVLAPDGLNYFFSTAGKLSSVMSASDDSNRAAPTYSFDPTSGNVTALTDPLSGRALSLTYATTPNPCATPPSGFDSSPPAGMLCKVSYPDGSVTNLFYMAGQLGRIVDPGSSSIGYPTTDFAYDSSGRLTKVRDPLGYDKVQTSPGTLDNDTTRTVIAYDTGGRVTTLTAPVPNAGSTPALPAPQRTYSYPTAGETQVNVIGLTPSSGFFRKVTFDPGTGVLLSDTDATNRTTSYEYDTDERLVITTDPGGLKTTTVYNAQGQVSDTYGPAPATCFTGQTPNGACTNPAVPHATSAYDEGIKGLAAVYWNNQTQTGPAIMHATGVGDSTGALNKDWVGGTPFDSNWTSAWSGRFTGDITFPQVGTYSIALDSDDGVRLYLDDSSSALIDYWRDHRGFSPSATFTNTVAGSRHRIDIEYYDNTQGAKIGLYWTPPGGTQALVPGDYLSPSYGLVTSTTDADGKKTATEYSNGSIGPEYGLATATVQDPAGLNLRTSTSYEAPGATGSYLRPLTKTLAKSSAHKTTNSYYGATEAAPTNNCGIGSSTVQAGMLKQTADADGVTKQFLYDGSGRLAGAKYSGDANWSCTGYDARGRVTSAADRNLASAATDYSTVGQITTTYTDSSGIVRSTLAKADLLGRSISYTDELGTNTRSLYDQAGRVTAMYRTFAGASEGQLNGTVYDDAGRPTSVTDYTSGTGLTTIFAYDTAGRSQTLTRPNGVVTTATYDPNQGRLTGLSNKAAGTTELSPWTYTLSAAGRIASETTTGRSRSFTYDGAGRLVTTSENSGTTIRNYAYDANTNRCANTTSCTTPTFTYDNADRITASPYASAYGYDAHGNTISTTGTTGNPSQKYGYDANDHATVTNDGTTTSVETLAPSGRVLRRVLITNATGAVASDTSFGYDGPGDSPAYSEPTPTTLGWPVIVTDSFVGANGDGWDSAKWASTSNDSTKISDIQSNQARLYVNGSPARATSQMTATADAELNLTYRFNERTAGSFMRIFMRASGATGANQMPNAYRVEVASDSSTIKLQKFVNSSVTQIGSLTYSMDTNPQRVRFQVQGSSIKVKVWPAGTTEPAAWSISATDTTITGAGVVQLTHSHSSGTHTLYVDDVTLSTPAPAVSPGVTTYIGGPTGLLATNSGGTLSYPLVNAHGDSVGTTDAAGSYTANPATDEFGRGTAPGSRLGWLGSQERFIAQPSTATIRMGARLYEPSLGRFLSVDPLEGGSANDYDYAAADPNNNYDLPGTNYVEAWGNCGRSWIATSVIGRTGVNRVSYNVNFGFDYLCFHATSYSWSLWARTNLGRVYQVDRGNGGLWFRREWSTYKSPSAAETDPITWFYVSIVASGGGWAQSSPTLFSYPYYR